MSRRIAVVGIDGAGKSTVIRRLLEREPGGDAVVVHCPGYHQAPDAPLGALSRAHEAYSQAADVLGSFELKAAALYAQMTLFGPVERAAVDTFAPRLLVCERHPVVDTLAYGPFYRRMVKNPVDEAAVAGPLARRELDARAPGGYAAVRAWHERENRRLGLSTSFWDVAHEVCALLVRPVRDLCAELCRRYRTSLPEAVIFLDVDAEEAGRRVAARAGGAAELHETAAYLAALRQSYVASLAALGEAHPEVKISTIETGGREVDACLDDLMEEVSHATR